MAEIVFDAPVPPDVLTAYITKYVPAPATNVLTSLAAVNYTPNDKVRWGNITRRNRMAKYRAYDGHIARTTRDAGTDSYVSLAPFSNSLMMGEYETLQREYARLEGGNKAVLADAIYNDATLLTTSMWNRVEKGFGDLLPTGQFKVDENETRFETDYAIPSANFITAAVPWSTITADAADELRAMVERYVASAGVRPGRIVTSAAVVSALCRNVQVVSEAVGSQTGKTRITRSELNAWLDSEQLPALVTEVEGQMWNDETGQQERVFPEDKIVLTPADLGSIMEFTFGMSASALKLMRSPSRVARNFGDARIVGMVIEDGPPYREFTYVDAVGLPILTGADQVVVGDVL